MYSIIAKINSTPWLIMPDWLIAIQNIALRKDVLEGIKNEYVKEQLKIRKEALSNKGGNKENKTAFVEKRGNVGILNIIGPILRYGNGMELSGPVRSLQAYAEDFKTLENDPKIDTIVLNIDSPGGEASGIDEFSRQIRRSKKRVIAYIDDLAASAGYWIAASADEIVASHTAMVGSIGVVFSILDRSKEMEKKGIEEIEIVSSISPKKRPDIKTQEGKTQIQAWADKLGKKFVEAIAEYRGVSTKTVIEEFGKGDIIIADEALSVGMIDEIGEFELLLEKLQTGVNMESNSNTSQALEGIEVTAEYIREHYSAVYMEIFNEGARSGAEAERERIRAIEEVAEPGFEEIIEKMKWDGESSAEDVELAIFRAYKKKRKSITAAIRSDAFSLGEMVEKIGLGAEDKKEDKEIQEDKEDIAAMLEGAGVKS